MKLSYKQMVKEPFILELSTDELITIGFHLHEAEEKLENKVRFCESYIKLSKDKEEKKWKMKHWRSCLRNLKDLKKVITDLEDSKKTMLWPKQ